MHGHSYTNSFHSLYRESPKNNEFIFDEIYRNASNKHKYSSNPKYTYFNALMQLKGKLSDNDGVYRKVFEAPRNKVHSSEVTAWPHTSVAPAPIYYV